ncbi:prolyl oligopeptidase family serine peptidase [Aquibacillus saliphilus]|uniref:prolyl oligopeptidase family serine peptidase n=1 Tax=Aquibacillus saliphilus TaxID=1909422 RepID=UPI001CF0B86E|nr:prolyl oligopeptidase family serine peptidase [Aquibacillus saliphilus]
MIGIYKEYWKNIPVLVIVQDDKKEKALPVLTYLHGYTSAKEHNLPLAFLMAERGYRIVLPDCMLHGERTNDNKNKDKEFFTIIEQNLIDLQIIKDQLDSRNLLLDQRFGVAGTSMGGITTAAALTQYDWIKAAAILMGSPKITEYAKELVDKMKQTNDSINMSDQEIDSIYDSLSKIDLSKQLNKLNGRPLFFWHGENDSVVPFSHSYDFYQQAINYYKNPESIRFLKEVGRGHKVSRFATLETVDWLEMQL